MLNEKMGFISKTIILCVRAHVHGRGGVGLCVWGAGGRVVFCIMAFNCKWHLLDMWYESLNLEASGIA